MKIGETVLQEEPYCHVLLQKLKGKRCDRCFTLCEDLKKCTGCSSMYYCNRTCQKRDWAVHKLECKCLKSVTPKIPHDSVRLMLRLIISQTLNLPMNSAWSRTLDNLMSHAEEIKIDAERSEELAKMCYTLSNYAGIHMTLPAPPQVLVLFGKMLVNSITIFDGELNDLGTGIYLSGSKLDHDCSPNAVTSFHGTTLVVTATQDIADTSPDEIFISYIDQLTPLSERHASLKKQYYFTCSCNKCSDSDYNALMMGFCCPKPNCQGAVGLIEEGEDLRPCSKCEMKDFPKQLRQGALHILKECKSELVKIGKNKETKDMKAVLSQCKAILKKTSGVLHECNVYVVRVLDYAMDAAIAEEEFELALKYGKRTLDSYKKYYPEFSPNLALQLFRVGKLQLYLQELETAQESLSRAQKIMAVTHGIEHEVCKEVTLFLNQCLEERRVNMDKS